MFSNICTQVLLVYFHDELWPKPVMIASDTSPFFSVSLFPHFLCNLLAVREFKQDTNDTFSTACPVVVTSLRKNIYQAL